jgi:hypothetical protein
MPGGESGGIVDDPQRTWSRLRSRLPLGFGVWQVSVPVRVW